jgi:hypothetical protein
MWAAVDVALIRHSPRGGDLSEELVLLLALILFDDYMLFPSDAERDARTPRSASLTRPSTRGAVAGGIEPGAGELIAGMGKRTEHK